MEKKQWALALSGAADEIGFLFGYVDAAKRKGVNYRIIHGTSSGAIIAFVMMCGNWDKSRDLILNFSPKKHIFGYNPFSPKGVYIALRSLLSGDNGFWRFNKLRKVLIEYTSKSEFEKYNGPDVYVGLVDSLGYYRNVKLNDLTYDQAIDAVIDSCSVSILIHNERNHDDGGLDSHIGSEFLAKKSNCNINSVFARTIYFNKPKPSKLINKMGWVLSRMFHNISVNDERITDMICREKGSLHKKIFMEKDVIQGMFTITSDQNVELYNMGFKSFKNG